MIDWTLTVRATALACCGSLASAQNFNIDVGAGASTPAMTYGAAANQSGFWNSLAPPFAGTLSDLGGQPTGASVTSTTAFATDDCGGPALMGDDAALLSDAQSVPGFAAPTEWIFTGLTPGAYTITTYSSCELAFSDSTFISVPGSPDPGQSVNGPWPGSHLQGATFARHQVVVGDGSLVVMVSSISPVDGPGPLNGFQLELDSPLPGNYCSSLPNSTGAPATIAFTGSISVAANNLVLQAAPVPNSVGLFYYGSQAIQAPFGDGLRCVGGPTFRLSPAMLATGGQMQRALDITSPPQAAGQILVGSVWYFQAWFRDPVPGSSGFNLSDGLAVAFQP